MADESLPRSAAGPHSPWLIAVIVSIATFMEVLDTTVANVALRHIAGSLAAGQDESTYIITSYLVANAIVLPISGWLMNVVGRKRFYMGCVVLFTVSSVLCAFATSLGTMLVARVLQGLGGGGLAPVEQSIFADSFPEKKRAGAFAIYGLTVVTAPAVGPMLGGWLTDNFSWHWVFLINLPVGALSLLLTGIFVSDSPRTQADRRQLLARGLRIDYLGALLVALGLGALQIVLDRFEREDGFSSPFILAFALVSGASLVALVVWELVVEQPIVDLKLFGSRAFAVSNVVMFLFGFVIISTTQLLPQLTQELLGYDATNAGLTLGLGGVISLFVMPIAGRVTGALVQPKWLVLMALVGTGVALLHTASLEPGIDFWWVSISRGLQVAWLPFIFIPLSAVQFTGVPPEKNNEASAIINLMRNLGGSCGVAVAVTELQWREQFHHARLAEHVTAFNGFGFGTSLGTIARAVETQARVLSYVDVFQVLAMVTLAVSPLALLLPKMRTGAAVEAH